jgi:hypothetical protein
VLASCEKGLSHSGEWHADRLGIAQIIETGHRHIVWHTHAALLKHLQRAEGHPVIGRDHSLKTEPALIHQGADGGSSAFGGEIAIDDEILIKTQVMRLKLIFIALKTLFRVDLTFEATEESDPFIAMVFDKVSHRGARPLRVVGNEHRGA